MSYVYHGVPEQMMGNSLVPLNQMGIEFLELKQRYSEKYEGRTKVLERRIALLDCLWNDVVQLLPLHPSKVFESQKNLGLIDKVSPYKFFKIDLNILDPEKTVVYFKTANGEENVEVKRLNDIEFESLQDIPKATMEYYESLVGTGELPFNYQFIPHILYLGEIDISSSEIIII